MLYIPTAGIETDGARESLAICFHELFLMGIQYENILVYNLELILSKTIKEPILRMLQPRLCLQGY